MPSNRNVNARPEASAAQLEADLRALDDEFAGYRETRAKYVQAIQALRGVAPASAPLVQKEKQPMFHGGGAAIPVVSIGRVEAIDEAIRSFPDKFTTVQVRDYIARKYPHLLDSIKKSYLPTRLTSLRRWRKIDLVGSSETGGPNTWVRL